MNDAIIISTGIDTGGFAKGSNALKAAMASLSQSAQKMGAQIKKIPGLLLGVSSVYSIISKAASTFLSQNEQLSSKLSSVWTALGNLIGPIIEQIINWVTTAVSHLLAFLKLLGVTNKTASQLSKSAAGAAGDLKKTVAGFDELNLLQENSGGSGAGSSGLQDIDPPAWMQSLVDMVKNGEWDKLAGLASDALIAGFNKLADAINSVDWKKIGAAIRDFFLNIKYEEIADAIFGVLKAAWRAAIDLLWGFLAGESEEKPPLIASLERIGESLSTLYDAIRGFVADAWETTLKPMLEWTATTGLPAVLDVLAGLIQKVAEIINEHGLEVQTVLVGIGTTIAALAIGQKVTGFISKLSKLWATLAANPVVLIIALIAGLAAAFIHAYQTNEEFRAKVDSAMTKVKEAIGGAVDWAKEKFEAFKEHIESAREKISGFRDKVVEVFEKIRDKATGLIEKIKDVFSFDWQIPPIKLPHITVAWEPTGDFARFFGVSALPHLGVEWYKTGGIVDGATLIGAGEDGKEAIIPLERHTEWIDMVADGLMSRISAGGFTFDKIGGLLSSLNSIAETVAFRMPAVAAGYVQPYSVTERAARMDETEGNSAGILEVLGRIEDRLYSLESEMENRQFVAQFGDLRILAQKITKEQRRNQISEGR